MLSRFASNFWPLRQLLPFSSPFSSSATNARPLDHPISLPERPPPQQQPSRPQHRHTAAYFATIHHISNIVRTDFYLERTLKKLRGLRVTQDLVYRVIRATSTTHPLHSLRFLLWSSSSHASTYRPSSPELDALLRALAHSHHWHPMWRTAHLMLSLNLPIPPSTFASLISSYSSRPEKAVHLFNHIPRLGFPQTLEPYNALLHVLVRSRNFPAAYALVRRMIRRGVSPDRHTFSTLVDGWCAAGKLSEARHFLEEMSARGCNPSVRGRDLLVSGLVSAGNLEAAKALARRMAKEGLIPDLTTFKSLVGALCDSGEVDFSLSLLDGCVKLGMCPDLSTYKILVPAVAKDGKIDEAFRLLNDAKEDGNKLFPSLYAPLLKALCRSGRFADAFSFFDDMKVEAHPPNRPVYTMLVKMCVRGGKFVDAAKFLVEMTKMGMTPRLQSFQMVVEGLKDCGDRELARKIEDLESSIISF